MSIKIDLWCECPKCEEWINFLDYPAEIGTENSKNVEVVCPECEHEFKVDCEY
jgi:hypothetical protein